MEGTLKVTEFKHVRINTQYFVNKFWGGFGSPLIYLQLVGKIWCCVSQNTQIWDPKEVRLALLTVTPNNSLA